jgi:hypothetical protein
MSINYSGKIEVDMQGYQIRIIGKQFIIWFNPSTHDFKTTDRKREK